jgi:hypothetical protein
VSATGCPASGYVADNTDCDDTDSAIYPGATELTGDEVDSDCDGTEVCYADADDDGYTDGSTTLSTDTDCTDSGEATSSDPTGECDDSDATVYPSATETFGDGVDSNCDGEGGPNWDDDGDGLTWTEEQTWGTSDSDTDSDGDGVEDGDEVNTYGTDPTDKDTDDGGVEDGYEVLVDGTDPTAKSDDADDMDGYGEGLYGGHFDVDSSTTLYPIGAGASDAHDHGFSDDYEVTGVDFFDMHGGKVHEITDDITDVDQPFKLIIANSDLSNGARVVLNGTYNDQDYTTWTKATIYDDTTPTVYSLSGAGNTTKLSSAGVYFHWLAIPLGQLHHSQTGCVKGNDAGANGEWRNGALTVQAVAVNTDGTDAYTADTSLSAGGSQGVARSGLLWEMTVFNHWGGPCYGASGWY